MRFLSFAVPSSTNYAFATSVLDRPTRRDERLDKRHGMLANKESMQPSMQPSAHRKKGRRPDKGPGMVANEEITQPSAHKQEMSAQTKDMAC